MSINNPPPIYQIISTRPPAPKAEAVDYNKQKRKWHGKPTDELTPTIKRFTRTGAEIIPEDTTQPKAPAQPAKRRKLSAETNPQELAQIADDYFAACDRQGNNYTYSGLCRALGLTYQGFTSGLDMEHIGPTLHDAKMRILDQLERHAAAAPAASIFRLKNLAPDMWRERQETDISIKTFTHYQSERDAFRKDSKAIETTASPTEGPVKPAEVPHHSV